MPDRHLDPFRRIPADWTVAGKVHAFTTCRHGGSSSAPYRAFNLGLSCGDETQRVLENRQILRQALPAEPHWLQQVHGTQVLEFPTVPAQAEPPELNIADAAITLQPGVVLSVLSADCLPIFMSNLESDAVGICHAGWRGLAAGVAETTAAVLEQRRPASAGWVAHLGPAIGAQSFEVGEEVRAAFCSQHPTDSAHFRPLATAGKYLANLYGLASRRLRSVGVQTITGGAYCTVRDQELFYSYRRDRQTGRMASLIWIEK